MVAQVQAKYVMAGALRSPGPPAFSGSSCLSPGGTDAISYNVTSRHIQFIAGHLADIATSLRGINQTMGGNPSRVAAAMRKLQDGSLEDSDSEVEEIGDDTGTPPPSQKNKKNPTKTRSTPRKRQAAEVEEVEESKSEEEEELVSSQALTQPLAAASSDLVAAAAAPAGIKPSGLLKTATPAAKKNKANK